MLATQFQDILFGNYVLNELDKWLAPLQHPDVEILDYIFLHEQASLTLIDWIVERMFGHEKGVVKVLAHFIKKVLNEKRRMENDVVSNQVCKNETKGESSMNLALSGTQNINEEKQPNSIERVASIDDETIKNPGLGLSRVPTLIRHPKSVNVLDRVLMPDFNHYVSKQGPSVLIQLEPELRYHHTGDIRGKPRPSVNGNFTPYRPRKVVSFPPFPLSHPFPSTWTQSPGRIRSSTADPIGQHKPPTAAPSIGDAAMDGNIGKSAVDVTGNPGGVMRQFTISRKPVPGAIPAELQGSVVSPRELLARLLKAIL
ncbi:hypothetical protein P154DRAFT_529929 [Amniculicola lignicola CBS 123094]|uniref:Uncharacterized protein n=1 Tax=Amniculicola lignicola CBS 123094 TaxID=1392246 RepID=A0A6A5X0V4_9PLEO|nr:hypothetical protein P154DRAFT_529929 [Amniculicola lignicola CBS 123094]